VITLLSILCFVVLAVMGTKEQEVESFLGAGKLARLLVD